LFAVSVAIVLLVTILNQADVRAANGVVAGLTISAMLAVGIRYSMKGKHPPLPVPLVWSIVYIFVVLLNAPIAAIDGVPMAKWLRIAFVELSMPVFALGVFRMTSLVHLRRLYWMTVWMMAGITSYYLTFWTPTSTVYDLETSYKTSLLDVATGRYASVLLVTLIFPFLFQRRTSRLLYSALFLLGLAGIVVTVGRTYWAVAPPVLVAVMVLFGWQRVRRVALPAMLACGLTLMIGTVLLQSASSLITYRLHAPSLSGTYRLEESTGLLASMKRSPSSFALGAGIGNSYQVYSSNRFVVGGLGLISRDFSHDYYLGVLWRTGILGLTAAIAIMASLVVGLRRSIQLLLGASDLAYYAAGMFSAFLTFGISAVVQHPFGTVMWGVVFGILTGFASRLCVTTTINGNAALMSSPQHPAKFDRALVAPVKSP
jgi:hypothetical protein